MKRHVWAISVAAVLVVTLLAAWVVWRGKMSENENASPDGNLPGEVGTFSIYTNGEYGFSVMYPADAVLDEKFDAKYHLSDAWRANALPSATGTPILGIVSYTTESDMSYPRYFVAQVRIGASNDPEEVARCEQKASEQGEGELPDVTINGTPFKAFSFQDAGMMQYVKGVSYRTVRDGACIAIEKIQTGSSYRDDAPSGSDISDEELQAEYEKLDLIIESFAFAHPS